MKRIITTLTVYIFLLTFSSNNLFAVSLFEKQILNFGKSYEKDGEYAKALGLYQNYQKNNDFSKDIADRIDFVRPKAKEMAKQKASRKKRASRRRREASSRIKTIYTIQLLTTNLQYINSAKRHKRNIERRYGFTCYLKEGKYLYLRCQDSERRSDLNDDISLLEDGNEDFFVVKLRKRVKEVPPEPIEPQEPITPIAPPKPIVPVPLPINDVKKDKEKTDSLNSFKKELESLKKQLKLLREEKAKREQVEKDAKIKKESDLIKKQLKLLKEEKAKRDQIEKDAKIKKASDLIKKKENNETNNSVKKPVKVIKVPKALITPKKDSSLQKTTDKEPKKAHKKPARKPKPLSKPATNSSNKAKKDKDEVLSKRPKKKKNPLLMNPSKRKKNGKNSISKKTSSKYTVSQGYKALNDKQNELCKKIFSDILKYNPKNIDAAFGYALAFMNDGNWVKAYITLKKVVHLTDRADIKKTFKGIKYNMYLKKGWKNVATSPDKSIEFFKKAQEVKDSSDISEGLAYAYSNNKELDKAIPEMEKLFQAKQNVKNANMLIKTYLKEKQVKKARIFFDSLDPIFQANMTYNPKRAELLAEAKKFLENKQYRQTKNLLRELYLMYPTNLTVLLYFAKVYEAEKEFKNSLEYYKTILAKEPKNKESLMGVSRIFIAKKEYSKALDILLKLEDVKEDKEVQSVIQETKLQLYLKNNNYKEALSLSKKMLMADPTKVKLYVILGDINVQMQNERDAYFYYGRAFQIEPADFDIRMKLLNLLLEQKLFDQTQTLLGKFKGFPLSSSQQQRLRDFYINFYKKYTSTSLQEKDYVYALKGAKSGLQMEPEDTFFIESAGWAALNSKKYSDAIYYFGKIIAKTPKNYTIHYGIGLAYVNLKQFNKAKQSFKTAEASSDSDLLFKVAEIYKDTGFKKDSYRVIKLIEELGRRSISHSNTMPIKEQQSAQMTVPPPNSNSRTDKMDTYNPFLSNFNNPKPPVQHKMIQPEIATPKKKNSNQWFF